MRILLLMLTLTVGYAKASSSSSQANERQSQCETVDLRHRLPPVRDQGTLGWCYAYMAADLASFHLKKNISPFDVALSYLSTETAKMDNQSLQRFLTTGSHLPAIYNSHGGSGTAAFNAASDRGFCLEKDLKSEVNFLNFQRLLFDINEIQTSRINYENPWRNQINRSIACDHSRSIKRIFTNLNTDEIAEVLNETTRRNIIPELANSSCQSRIKTDLKMRTSPTTSPSARITEGHAMLDSGEIFGIAYPYDILVGKTSSTISHGSTVVGRSWNASTKKCEFIVRDSYGSNCEKYDVTMKCENGHIWVPEEILMRNAEIYYIKK